MSIAMKTPKQTPNTIPVRFRWFLPVAAAALPLAACSLTPVYERPQTPVPAQWDAASANAGDAVDAQWWQRFGSEELNQLMSQALAANHDLAAAVSRIEQARASARIAGAARLPSADASISASRSRQEEDDVSITSSSDQAVLSVSYELDLWGGNAAAAASADARVAVSVYNRDSVELVLQSDVASNYFQILALQDRLKIAQKNLEAAQQLMRLVEVRFDNGAATALDLAQQRTTLLGIQADIPSLQQSLKETQNALAVLLGQAPQGFAVRGQSLGELKLPAVDAGQPTALLERRPDIRIAEANLIAANADIGAARAALYPSVSLSASAGAAGLITGGSSTVASIAASLVQTIFDGGRLRGQVALSKAARQELVENYAQAVLTSLQEVENGLSAVNTNATRADLLDQTAAQAREAYRLALIRYRSGAADLLALLDSQRSQLSAEDSLVQTELARYTAAISLYKALGGGWAKAPSA
jgi:NodT family efflux transporter outer membrane factor (OMF) lipoprotein